MDNDCKEVKTKAEPLIYIPEGYVDGTCLKF